MSDFKKNDRTESGARKRREYAANKAEKDTGLQEKVVHVNRCAKVVKGGRRFGFSALVVVGNQAGRVGGGCGKAKEVVEAVRKGTEQAKKHMASFLIKDGTVPHESVGVSDGGRVLLRPAGPGTGVKAGGGVRTVLEVLGITDVLTKSLGSKNPFSVVRATLKAIKQMRTYDQVRSLRAANGDNPD